MTVRNIESDPSDAGPDLDGIEQGITNDEVRLLRSFDLAQNKFARNDKGSVKVKVESAKPQCKV